MLALHIVALMSLRRLSCVSSLPNLKPPVPHFSRVQSHQRAKLSRMELSSQKKDWDNLIDDDDDEDSAARISAPPDMKYMPRNVMRQHENFVAMRQAGGVDVTRDVYVREQQSQVFWFVGKVSYVSTVSLQQCVAKQWPLIEMHAANLRPIELFPSRGSLEIWTAPGDSEMDVAYNRPDVVFQKMVKDVDFGGVKNNLVGFQGEVYERGEEGFRTWRLEDGRPAKPEVQSPSQDEEYRPPTEDELEKLQEALKDKDINELYEEQQRREANS